MTMSTQRLVAILLMVNLVISISMGVMISPRELDSGRFTDASDGYKNYGDDLRSEEDIQSADSLNEEGTFGSAGSMGGSIVSLMLKGLHPLPFRDVNFEDDVLEYVAQFLVLFRGFLTILLGLEVYLLIKNRKAT